jgi:DNA-binding CsgD family transcriptional regulator
MSASQSKLLDTSSELLIYRHGGGIKLARPEDQCKQNKLPGSYYTGHTVGSCLDLNCCVYFGNVESQVQKINDPDAALIGCSSTNEAIGKDAYSFIAKENAAKAIRQDVEALSKNEAIVVEDTYIWENKPSQSFIGIKAPWYDTENRIIGVFGFCLELMLGEQPIRDFLGAVSQMSMLTTDKIFPGTNNTLLGFQIDDTYLSKREVEVLKQVALGKSARVVGAILGISQRTVESHLENIKAKLNVYSKAELVDKAVHAFYGK